MDIPAAHNDLLLNLNKEIGSEAFHDIKVVVKGDEFGNLRAGELEKITSFGQLWNKLEHKQVIRVGDYKKLRVILQKSGISSAVKLIEKAEHQLSQQGQPSADLGAASSDYSDFQSPMEIGVPRSLNTNNSRKLKQKLSFDDALPISSIDCQTAVIESRPRYEQGRGYALFINNFVEEAHDKRYIRKHSRVDETNLENLFDECLPNCKFVVKEDLTRRKLMTILKDTQRKLREGNFSHFLLIVCSHGMQNVSKENSNMTEECILMVDGETISEEELTAPFLGEELEEFSEKPKVFMIQACRSPKPRNMHDGVGDQVGQSDTIVRPPSLSCPVNANVLISYATSKGNKAWRNETDGSWFIKHFCVVARTWYKKEHLMDMLVRVNMEVAKMESDNDGSKQMPCQVSTMTKDMWL